MYLSNIARGALILATVAAYSATVYTLSEDANFLQEQQELNTTQAVYSHTPEDVQKIRAALRHEVSGVKSTSVIPGAECIIYRRDVHSNEFNTELAECLEPNLPVELVR